MMGHDEAKGITLTGMDVVGQRACITSSCCAAHAPHFAKQISPFAVQIIPQAMKPLIQPPWPFFHPGQRYPDESILPCRQSLEGAPVHPLGLLPTRAISSRMTSTTSRAFQGGKCLGGGGNNFCSSSRRAACAAACGVVHCWIPSCWSWLAPPLLLLSVPSCSRPRAGMRARKSAHPAHGGAIVITGGELSYTAPGPARRRASHGGRDDYPDTETA